MVLDGGYSHALAIAAELKRDLNATIVGAGYASGFALSRSRHCDAAVVLPSPAEDRFGEELLRAIDAQRPDVVVPVGFASHARLVEVGAASLAPAQALVPEPDEFEVATDKLKTYELAKEAGIRVPADRTESVAAALAGGDPGAVDFPVFLKARRERGGAGTALLRSPAALEREARDYAARGEEVLYQEVIDADPYTYACCGLYQQGAATVSFSHLELRSVPRHGGSGTRVAWHEDPALAALATTLMARIGWTGIAQVEFKRDRAGQLVLMEVNPKFWASYALPSRLGYRFATQLVAALLGIDVSWLPAPQRRPAQMVFPVREFGYALAHRGTESIARSLTAMLWPPAMWDVELSDLKAYLPRRLWPGRRRGGGP